MFEDVTMPRSYTTLLLHNVMSAVISNVAFTNIQGYVLFGINLFIKMSLTNVSITDQPSSSYTDGSKGIILLNAPTSGRVNHNQLQECFMFITDCKFYSMHGNANRYTNNFSSIYHKATAIALIINQQTVVNISNVAFANIISDSIPVVLISCILNKPTSVTVTNSIFTNISCLENSVFDVKFLSQSQGLPFSHKFYFQDCRFSYNKVAQLVQMSSLDITVNNGASAMIKLSRLLLVGNIATNAIWKINMNRHMLNTSVLIEDCMWIPLQQHQ